ncbi:methionine biosynthesis protein MetW [Candidatus Parcubacteria bacterium]|nr:methionine biosynthesis protein MetW [Patescibacteria group bacterium]MBU4477231.1 methionine biosynthesis protein MetW [Patescibacteria group bacterium]MCG2699166.1 methionine biosynthesis protein MetW [Candidatus Parcubacteria bacterium]
MNNAKEFENKRWRESDQPLVFRHAKAIEMVEKGQKVLDVGCGDGLFLNALAQKEVLASGVDISEEGVKKCGEKGLDASVVDISIENLPFQDGAFDTVIMLDVLEHLYAPEALLQEAARVSKKYIIISVPNFNSLPARLQVLFGNAPENNRPNKGHVYWFNYKILKKMLKNNNMKQITLKTNTFWEQKIVLDKFMKLLAQTWPSMFALSFVFKLEKC